MCFDIGANVGTKSQLFLSLGAKVIAFEPQSACLPKLKALKMKHPNFDYFPYGIGPKNEAKELRLATHSEVASFSEDFIQFYTTDETRWDEKELVTVKTIDSVISIFGLPNYCKIDTEGYELDIVSSLHYKIPMIEFEFTEGLFEDTLKIIDILDSSETTFNFILNENLKFRMKRGVSATVLKEKIKALPKNRLHGNIFVKTKVS